MMTSIVMLETQMSIKKFRSSKLIIKSDARKHMIKSSFELKFHDLEYYASWNSLSYSLNSFYTWGHHHKTS